MAQTATSPLFKALGAQLDKAVKTHANDATTYGIQELPPGIKGIAQIVSAKFGQYKKGDNVGKWFFMAQASIHKPDTFLMPDGTPFKCRGKFTKIGPEPLCETKNTDGEVTTFDEHVARILLWLRRMMGEEYTKQASGANLEALAAQVEKAKPFIEFETSGGEMYRDKKTKEMKRGKVYHNWGSRVDYDPKKSSKPAVEDDSGAPPTDGASLNGEAGDFHGDDDPGNQDQRPDDQGADQGGDTGGEPDIEALVEAANAADPDSEQKLTDMAIANGWGEEVVRNAKAWEEVADMARNAPDGGDADQGGDETTTASAPEFKPGKDVTCSYKPVVNGVPAKKAVKVVITATYGKAKTADLKNLSNPRTVYKNVPFAELIAD